MVGKKMRKKKNNCRSRWLDGHHRHCCQCMGLNSKEGGGRERREENVIPNLYIRKYPIRALYVEGSVFGGRVSGGVRGTLSLG